MNSFNNLSFESSPEIIMHVLCMEIMFFFAKRIQDWNGRLICNVTDHPRVCIKIADLNILLKSIVTLCIFIFSISLPPNLPFVGAYGGAFKVHIISWKVRKRIVRVHCNNDTTKYHNNRWLCHVHTDYQRGICLFQSAIHLAFLTSFSE